MKRKLRFIYMICIAFLIGFFYTNAVYTNLVYKIVEGLTFYPWYVHILFILLGLQLGITIHELGHFISAKKQGIPVKAFYAFIFVFVKQDGKWRFSIMPKFAKMIGGLVMLSIESVTDKTAYETTKSKLSKIINAGPKTSLYYGVLTTIMLCISVFTNAYYLIGFLFTIGIFNILFTVLVMISSSFSKQGLYGDFVASKKIRTDEIFTLAYITSGLSFSETETQSMDYLWPQIIEVLETYPVMLNPQVKSLLNNYLEETVYKERIGCSSIDEKITTAFRHDPRNEEEYGLFFEMFLHQYSHGNTKYALERLEQVKTIKLNIDDKVVQYWHHYIEHVLGVENHTNFLAKTKNLYPNAMYWMFHPIVRNQEVVDFAMMKKDNL